MENMFNLCEYNFFLDVLITLGDDYTSLYFNQY